MVEVRKPVQVKIAGEAGMGIKSAGKLLTLLVKRSGYYTFGYTEYPSLIRGGHNTFQVVLSDRPVSSVYRIVDILISLNFNSLKEEVHHIGPESWIVLDEKY